MGEGVEYEFEARVPKAKFGIAARTEYTTRTTASLAEAQSQNLKETDCYPEFLETQAKANVIIACDMTGSMGEWPKTIFSKFAFLCNEFLRVYGVEGPGITFGAIGDSRVNDEFPLQMQSFISDLGSMKPKDATPLLMNSLGKLLPCGGGSNPGESYELMAAYLLHRLRAPNMIRKPLVIMIADEPIFPDFRREDAKRFGLNECKSKTSSTIFEKLGENVDLYHIHKSWSSDNEGSLETWRNAVGENRISELDDPNRVVDVILGIMAKWSGKEEEFMADIMNRQTPEQIKTVHTSLSKILDKPSDGSGSTHVGMLGKGKTAKSLI